MEDHNTNDAILKELQENTRVTTSIAVRFEDMMRRFDEMNARLLSLESLPTRVALLEQFRLDSENHRQIRANGLWLTVSAVIGGITGWFAGFFGSFRH